MDKAKIVAEIGCNHNGDLELAKTMISTAKEAGADAVKFQTFVPEQLVSRYAAKAEYQNKNDSSSTQLDMLKKLILTYEEYQELVKYANTQNIEIFSTPFDDTSITFLQEVGQTVWKIPSGEITDLPYLERVTAVECLNKEIILSTGMSSYEEIRAAVKILCGSRNTKFTILHCNTQYPTKPVDMNLRAMNMVHTLVPDWRIGLSDHSEGIIAALVAVGMGAKFIEKHFTLDKNLPGPDHKASATPCELKALCDGIRTAEIMLGSNEKKVTSSEQKNIFAARKSIVAKRSICRGEAFSEKNITCKRPGNGISPMYWYEVLGRKSECEFIEDELISCGGICWENE